jgi:hypothetical protein
MHIAIMNLKSLWERHRAERWAATADLPAKAGTPNSFQPLTRDEFKAILDDTILWLMHEARATYLMPEGPSKDRRGAELRARSNSIAEDYRRLLGDREG